MDGARLGAALTCINAELTMAELFAMTDALFIGGTKNGALLGEALVIRNQQLQEDVRYLIKQRGGLLAKGRVLGIQFEELFRENLYFDLAKQSNEMAQYMASELKSVGCSFWIESPTNQIFPIINNSVVEELQTKFEFYVWAKVDDERSAIRLVTSWATPENAVKEFVEVYMKARHETK